jgi:histidyl-tRNA synthetase
VASLRQHKFDSVASLSVFRYQVNNRKLLNEVMTAAGKDVSDRTLSSMCLNGSNVVFELCSGVPPALLAAACVIIDKADKLPPAEVAQQLRDAGLAEDVAAALLAKLGDVSLDELEGSLGQGSEGAQELRQLLQLLSDGYGIGEEWVTFSFSVVRGLAYYTGTVFEGADKAGKLRAICGGGRYDSLYQTMGGQKAIPAAGFGFGDAVIMELLKDKGLEPRLEGSAVDVMVFAWDETLRPRAMRVATELRAAGLRVDLVLEPDRKLKAVLPRADRSGAAAMVLLAPDEHAAGTTVVRDLKRGEQTALSYTEVGSRVQAIVSETRRTAAP